MNLPLCRGRFPLVTFSPEMLRTTNRRKEAATFLLHSPR